MRRILESFAGLFDTKYTKNKNIKKQIKNKLKKKIYKKKEKRKKKITHCCRKWNYGIDGS